MSNLPTPYTDNLKAELRAEFTQMAEAMGVRIAGQLEGALARACDAGAAAAGKRPVIAVQVDPATGQQIPPSTTDPCRSYASEIQQATQRMCNGVVRDQCDLELIDDAANAGAFPLIEDELQRQEMSFVPTGARGTGLNAEKLATIFDADATAVAPGHSVLLKQDPNYPLPWRMGCLESEFTWSDGLDAANYKHIRITVWVAWKTTTFNTNPALPIGEFGKPWNKYQVIKGKDLFCDGCTKPVAIAGPTGCAERDPVGREAMILLQVDNLATAAETITSQSIKVLFAGFKPPCCDSCQIGKSCNCGH